MGSSSQVKYELIMDQIFHTKFQSHVNSDTASSKLFLQGIIFSTLQSKLVCISYAQRIAKQDATMELPTSGKLTTWLLVCYFLPLDKPYILLSSATAFITKEAISKHWLKRWKKKSLKKIFLEMRINFITLFFLKLIY